MFPLNNCIELRDRLRSGKVQVKTDSAKQPYASLLSRLSLASKIRGGGDLAIAEALSIGLLVNPAPRFRFAEGILKDAEQTSELLGVSSE
jgi:ProP effector